MRASLPMVFFALLPLGCQAGGAAGAPEGAQAMFVLDKLPTWMGCAASVRDALEDVPGVTGVDVTPNDPEITVHFDRSRTHPEALLQALQAAGQPARPR